MKFYAVRLGLICSVLLIMLGLGMRLRAEASVCAVPINASCPSGVPSYQLYYSIQDTSPTAANCTPPSILRQTADGACSLEMVRRFRPDRPITITDFCLVLYGADLSSDISYDVDLDVDDVSKANIDIGPATLNGVGEAACSSGLVVNVSPSSYITVQHNTDPDDDCVDGASCVFPDGVGTDYIYYRATIRYRNQ